MNSSKFRTNTLPYLASIVGVGIVLEIIAGIVKQPYFPKISKVLVRLASLLSDGEVLSDFGRSLQNLFVGFLISVVLGVSIGVLCGRRESVERMIRPYVNIMLTSPSILLLELLVQTVLARQLSLTLSAVWLLQILEHSHLKVSNVHGHAPMN